MTVAELIASLQECVSDGIISADAVVVRPRCSCDARSGYVEAGYLDEVHLPPQPSSDPDHRLFGPVDPDHPLSYGVPAVRLA